MNPVSQTRSIVRGGIEAIGLDRVENFVFMAMAMASFFASIGFWVGIPLSRWQMMAAGISAMVLAMVSSGKMLFKFLALCSICILACAYTFSYCGIDASVYHVPVQRLLNEGWNPIFQSDVEDVRQLTDNGCMAYHAAFLPRFVEFIGALIAKMSGLFVADTFFHYFAFYFMFSAGTRFAKLQWDCAKWAAVCFGVCVALPSQIGTMMGSAIDYPLYSCLATATFSMFNWERTHKRGELFLVFTCLCFAILMKFTGLVVGVLILGMFVVRNWREKWLLPSIIVLMCFCAIVGAAPYITSWVRYGSPFYPTHSFDPTVRLVNITDDFTANADGASMGYLARIVYAWFSTKLACWGCAWWQGKDTFNPVFYVPVGVDGLKAWFRVLMWLSVFALAISRKNRVASLCVLVFVLMNIAPLKYIGYGRYFMLMWLIPPLALFNLVYNPQHWIRGVMKYARFGVYALLLGLAIMVSTKTTMLYLRALGIEGARQVVFREAADKGLWFVPDRPMREFGIKERLTHVKGLDYPVVEAISQTTKFDSVLYFPYGLSITPRQINNDFPRVDNLRQFRQFRFDWLFANLPKVLWEK